MRVFVRCVLASAAVGALACAQAPQEQRWMARLGNDTVAVERFQPSASGVEGDLLVRTPQFLLMHYTLELNAEGQPTTYTVRTSRPAGDSSATTTTVTRFEAGRLAVSIAREAGVDTFTVEAAGDVSPTIYANTYAMGLLERALAPLTSRQTDSIEVLRYSAGARRVGPVSLVRSGSDTIKVGWFQGLNYFATLDQSGAVAKLDGVETTVKTVNTPDPSLQFDSLLARWTAAEQSGTGLGQLSPRDTARGTVGRADLWVDYSRPSMRGRTIWGGIVPMDTVWRTGANAATQFSTSRPLTIGALRLPAGMYTLWSIHHEGADSLIVNKQTGQWGTVYDGTQDFGRVPVTDETLADPVEQFTIAIAPTDAGGELQLTWDRVRWHVPFTVR